MFHGRADEELRAQIKVMREMGATQAAIDAKMAQNILHEDLGYFASKTTEYDLDPQTRDKLLAHARQDAAHAVYAAMSAANEVRKLRRILLVFAIVGAVFLGWTVFQ